MAIPKLTTSAERLLDGAQGYYDSLELLSKSPSQASVDAIGLLASHSLEIALKAFLLMKGLEEKQLSKDIGHNLEAAWIKAVQNGLPIETEPPYWVKLLALGHDFPYLYRYPQENTAIGIPPTDELVPNLNGLIRLIKIYIMQS